MPLNNQQEFSFTKYIASFARIDEDNVFFYQTLQPKISNLQSKLQVYIIVSKKNLHMD
jgi:hypothetical protein